MSSDNNQFSIYEIRKKISSKKEKIDKIISFLRNRKKELELNLESIKR